MSLPSPRSGRFFDYAFEGSPGQFQGNLPQALQIGFPQPGFSAPPPFEGRASSHNLAADTSLTGPSGASAPSILPGTLPGRHVSSQTGGDISTAQAEQITALNEGIVNNPLEKAQESFDQALYVQAGSPTAEVYGHTVNKPSGPTRLIEPAFAGLVSGLVGVLNVGTYPKSVTSMAKLATPGGRESLISSLERSGPGGEAFFAGQIAGSLAGSAALGRFAIRTPAMAEISGAKITTPVLRGFGEKFSLRANVEYRPVERFQLEEIRPPTERLAVRGELSTGGHSTLIDVQPKSITKLFQGKSVRLTEESRYQFRGSSKDVGFSEAKERAVETTIEPGKLQTEKVTPLRENLAGHLLSAGKSRFPLSQKFQIRGLVEEVRTKAPRLYGKRGGGVRSTMRFHNPIPKESEMVGEIPREEIGPGLVRSERFRPESVGGRGLVSRLRTRESLVEETEVRTRFPVEIESRVRVPLVHFGFARESRGRSVTNLVQVPRSRVTSPTRSIITPARSHRPVGIPRLRLVPATTQVPTPSRITRTTTITRQRTKSVLAPRVITEAKAPRGLLSKSMFAPPLRAKGPQRKSRKGRRYEESLYHLPKLLR
jgi:hypothetical protein